MQVKSISDKHLRKHQSINHTGGFIKALIRDCLEAAGKKRRKKRAADLLPQLVNILILHLPATEAVFMEADLQPDKDRSLLDRPGHTRSSSGPAGAAAAYCKELTVSEANASQL